MMTIQLRRTYHAAGTNGQLSLQGQPVCGTIELPWRGNRQMVSCIPEGRYRLYRHTFPKHGDQLGVAHVPGRAGILIHPGNDARQDLRGCIAPVTTLTGPGTGISSRAALERLKALVYPAMERGEEVWLVVVEGTVVSDR
ncbi:DUF5675 family protein [Parapedobacter koreensis]|uniref:DUF5675 domain-containing protein n=1 Tax=Parapedobacter koreensis TaxID=332977 RepID=A0A1H7Q1G6_9SPHI|nr:DUF5675 family protein [Parapedobacter koreensis]SEL41676.1 hypothetical protein SAMN05421740_105118 [Parapedobacter koreensis]